jgi:hypothetical protein
MLPIWCFVVCLSWVCVVARARWMFDGLWRAMFALGLGLLAGAVILALPATEEAEALPAPSYQLVRVCLALGAIGALFMVVALGLWWAREHRGGRDGQLPPASHSGQRLFRRARSWGNLGMDGIAVLLLPVGGVVPGLGWLIVMVLLWTSLRWTAREKLLATVAVPGGPPVAYFAVEGIASLQLSAAGKVPLLVATVPLLLVPTGAAVYLAVRAWRRGYRTAPVGGKRM